MAYSLTASVLVTLRVEYGYFKTPILVNQGTK